MPAWWEDDRWGQGGVVGDSEALRRDASRLLVAAKSAVDSLSDLGYDPDEFPTVRKLSTAIDYAERRES